MSQRAMSRPPHPAFGRPLPAPPLRLGGSAKALVAERERGVYSRRAMILKAAATPRARHAPGIPITEIPRTVPHGSPSGSPQAAMGWADFQVVESRLACQRS